MSSPLHRRAFHSLVRRLAEARRRSPDGEVVSGHHNTNLVLPLGRPLAYLLGESSGRVLAKFRTPLPAVEVVPRIWRRESEVLEALSGRLSQVPRCLADFGEWSLHDYLPGRALADEVPAGRIGETRVAALAEFFAGLAGVREADLPPLPADWPVDGDSGGFLGWLARFAEQKVNQANRPRFGRLFDDVGIPFDAVDRFMTSVPELTPRPFALLHTDVHRANVLVVDDPETHGERLAVIDWELALCGDPLHDLATHLVRMDYHESEYELMLEQWTKAMLDAGHADMTADRERDLNAYLGFEYVQSLYPDVMRAALYLPDDPGEQDLSEAAGRVHRALSRARKPLSLAGEPPDEHEIREALSRWHSADREWRTQADGGGEGSAQEEIARPSEARRWRTYRSRTQGAERTAADEHREPTGVCTADGMR